MEATAKPDDEATPNFARDRGATINDAFAAFYYEGDVYFQRLRYLSERPKALTVYERLFRTTPCLALFPGNSRLLAVSRGSRISIFDLISESLQQNLSDVGRAVTSLACLQTVTGVRLVAAGLIDGSVCIYRSYQSTSFFIRSFTSTKCCQIVAFSLTDEDLLASNHGDTISIWRLGPGFLKNVGTIDRGGAEFLALAWQPSSAGRLVVASSDRQLLMYDVGNLTRASANVASSDTDTEDDLFMFDRNEPFGQRLQAVATVGIESPLKFIRWMKDDIFLGLADHGHRAWLYQIVSSFDALSILSTFQIDHSAENLHIRNTEFTPVLITVSSEGIFHSRITTGAVPLNATSAYTLHPEDSLDKDFRDIRDSESTGGSASIATWKVPKAMTPSSISKRRCKVPTFIEGLHRSQARFGSTTQRDYGSSVAANGKRGAEGEVLNIHTSPRGSIDSTERPETSSQKTKVTEIPFLSPGIPARVHTTEDLPRFDDTALHLPPLLFRPPRSSNVSVVHSTAVVSDDSDDDSFVHGVALMPGGVNVPLPKACGALFAPTGQLLTFFPPAREKIPLLGHRVPDRPRSKTDPTTKLSRFFPSFGNLTDDFQKFAYGSETECSGSLNNHGGSPPFRNELLNDTAPRRFEPDPWAFDTSPSKPESRLRQGQAAVVISVHELHDVASICPEQHSLAGSYRLFRQDGESDVDVCHHNSEVAGSAGLHDSAILWRLLALLLQGTLPDGSLDRLRLKSDIVDIAHQADVLSQRPSKVPRPCNVLDHNGSSRGLHWVDHPLGARWLVRRVLAWAESKADVQMLAHVSCILAGVGEATQQRCIATLSAESSGQRFQISDHLTAATLCSVQGVRKHGLVQQSAKTVIASSTRHDRANKAAQALDPKRSGQSLTSISYKHSGSASPVSGLLSLARSGTGASLPGSSSPEFSRGSFSAAAKHYAQSISDKFASYSSSPITKKLGTSPSTSNDQPSSLPIESWPGKSVSFASTVVHDDDQGSPVRQDNSHEDDHQDGESTMGESSEPLTRKRPRGAVAVTTKNQTLISDEALGCAHGTLLDDELLAKAGLWCQYYAEQLRTWSMYNEAAELERLATARGITLPTARASASESSIIPTPIPRQRSRACSICWTRIEAIEQLCPACLHISHLTCIQEYVAALEGDPFTCPTGCGCACADLSPAYEEIRHAPTVNETLV